MMIVSFKKSFEIDVSNFTINGGDIFLEENFEPRIKSQFEKDYLYILENDHNIVKYIVQPFIVTYHHHGIRKRIVPEFYVKYIDGTEGLILLDFENSNQSELQVLIKGFAKKRIKCDLLSKECFNRANDLIFNYKFLSSYHNKGDYINEIDMQLIFITVRRFKKITVKNLLNELAISFEKKAEFLFIVWYLINSKLLNFNKEEKLSINTIIWE